MTGAYVRVERDGKMTNVEVEYLTNKERYDMFSKRDATELLAWINLLCDEVKDIEEMIKREFK